MKIIKEESYYQGDRLDILQYVPDRALKILEVGCGEGKFAQNLITENREIWGVELNTKAAETASSFLYRVFDGPIEQNIDNLPDNYFDLIIFNDVLEHLIDPSSVLEQIRQKLKTNGEILASIPNLRFAKVTYNLIFKKDFTYTEFGILDSTHLRFFTIKTMKNLFENTGYKVKLLQGLNRSPSKFSFIYMLFFSLITLSNNSDMLYPQFLILAKKQSIS